MNHDYEHCIDFNDSCPESCFRARLVRDLEQNYPPSMEVSWMSFGDFPDCQKNARKNNTETHACDCVSRKAATYALNEYFVRIGKLKRRGLNEGEKAISLDVVGVIKGLPPVTPKQRTGEWLYYHGDDIQGFYGHPYCSECYGYAPFKADGSAAISPFCPNCGAKMDGKE